MVFFTWLFQVMRLEHPVSYPLGKPRRTSNPNLKISAHLVLITN